jgi:VWFA-related protein
MKYSLIILLLALLITPVFTQDYEVAVTTVNVWIRATDGSGNTVTGLNQADFDVYEDGKKMNPSCFEEVNFSMPEAKDDAAADDTAAPQSAEAKVTQPKRFIVYLDLFNTSQAEMDRLRPDIDIFLRRIHQKDWETMMVAYLPSGKLGVVVPFTKSISSVRKALEQAKGSTNRDQQLKKNENEILEILAPLQVHRTDAQDQPEGGGNSGGGTGQFGRQGNTALIEDQVFQMAMSSAYRQAAIFARQDKEAVEHAFGGLESFGEYYGKNLSNGEHTVVMFVSGGFNSDPGRRYFELVNNYLNRTAAAVDPADFMIKSGSPTKENNFDLARLVNDSIGRLNRYNITLYSINTRGLDSSAPDVTKADKNYAALDTNLIKDYQDSLSQMAEETGGLSFQNTQNFKLGFDSMLDDISHQYLVCYRSPDHKKGEKYHSIKVVSKKPGLKLRYRQGYVD